MAEIITFPGTKPRPYPRRSTVRIVPPRPRLVPLAEQIETAKAAAQGFRRLAVIAGESPYRARMEAIAERHEAHARCLEAMRRGHQQPAGELFQASGNDDSRADRVHPA